MQKECRDIQEYQSVCHQDKQIVNALMHGHIVNVAGVDYRFARSGQRLFSIGDTAYAAVDSGIYQRVWVQGDSENNAFRWVLHSNQYESMFSIIEQMTEEEKMCAIANMSFDAVLRQRG